MNTRKSFKPPLVFAAAIFGLAVTLHTAGTQAQAAYPSVLVVGTTLVQSSGSPCQGTRYTGTLSFTGDFDYQPNGSYYYSSSLGFHKGCLVGPSSGDFDLYLQKWNGTAWVIVAGSESATSNETISSFNGPGYYRWQIYSYSGSGSYNFWRQSP